MRNLLRRRSGCNVRGYQWFCTTSRFHTLHALMRAKFLWCYCWRLETAATPELSCRIFYTLVERKPNDLLRLLWTQCTRPDIVYVYILAEEARPSHHKPYFSSSLHNVYRCSIFSLSFSRLRFMCIGQWLRKNMCRCIRLASFQMLIDPKKKKTFKDHFMVINQDISYIPVDVTNT